jgi:hypothetical protein
VELDGDDRPLKLLRDFGLRPNPFGLGRVLGGQQHDDARSGERVRDVLLPPHAARRRGEVAPAVEAVLVEFVLNDLGDVPLLAAVADEDVVHLATPLVPHGPAVVLR